MNRSHEPIALDGKTLRGSQGGGHARQLVAAFGHTSHVVFNQVEVADKASEQRQQFSMWQ